MTNKTMNEAYGVKSYKKKFRLYQWFWGLWKRYQILVYFGLLVLAIMTMGIFIFKQSAQDVEASSKWVNQAVLQDEQMASKTDVKKKPKYFKVKGFNERWVPGQVLRFPSGDAYEILKDGNLSKIS